MYLSDLIRSDIVSYVSVFLSVYFPFQYMFWLPDSLTGNEMPKEVCNVHQCASHLVQLPTENWEKSMNISQEDRTNTTVDGRHHHMIW